MVSLTEKSARFEHTLVTLEEHVATITLNRPHRRNALNYPAYDELEQSLRAAAADPEVRCVIVTGADPAFCSGDDVGEIMAGPKPVSRAPMPVTFSPTPAAMAALECDKPLIAAVNGAAVGWGMELALFADIRIASERRSSASCSSSAAWSATWAASTACRPSSGPPRLPSCSTPAT